MDLYTVGRYAEVLAIQAEIEAMKAANKEREMNNESLAYGEGDFMEKAHDLESKARDFSV